MEIEEIKNKTQNLARKILGINEWIKENPTKAVLNVSEIMDYSISLAELFGEYAKFYQSKKLFGDIIPKHEEVRQCYSQLIILDELYATDYQPFFKIPEVKALYRKVRDNLPLMDYDVPEDLAIKKIKKELLCKSMSIAFNIWQVHRNEPDYQYDNAAEFDAMKDMLATYKAYGNTQFLLQIESLFGIIEKNYKYSTTENISKHV